MFFLTHVSIGNYLYKYLKKQDRQKFQVSRLAFIYGNVKPDVNELVWLKHNYQETREFYFENLEDAKNIHLPIHQRSVAMGVVCHFICDYFCKYHSKEKYAQKSLLKHFIYEMKLHIHICSQLRKPLAMNPLAKHKNYSNMTEHLDDYLKQKESLHLDYVSTMEALNIMLSQVPAICKSSKVELSSNPLFEMRSNKVSA